MIHLGVMCMLMRFVTLRLMGSSGQGMQIEKTRDQRRSLEFLGEFKRETGDQVKRHVF